MYLMIKQQENAKVNYQRGCPNLIKNQKRDSETLSQIT